MLQKISEKELMKNEKSIDDSIILGHLKKLYNTIFALRMKYWFNGLVDDRQVSKLMLDVIDSGFPMRKEIIELRVDKKNAQEAYQNLPDENEIKHRLLAYVLNQKKISLDLQYDLSIKEYYGLLLDDDFFFPENQPEFIRGTNARNGNRRYVAHWSVYDAEKNIPNVYIMVFEHSGGNKLEENPDLIKELRDFILKDSISTLKLINIASNVDKGFATIHPKSLKRVHIGPLYSNGLTKHNDYVQSVLDGVNTEDNWVFAWSTEMLLSKGIRQVTKGFFGSQQEEIFHVDAHDLEAFEAGSTDVEKNMIIPYESYQALIDAKENPLNSIQKYVINKDGAIIYL
jgi:hypothetical protein